MNTAIQQTYDELLKEFKASLDAGINGFMNAGDIYVRAIDQDPEYADRLQEELKDIVPGRAWSQLEALGRKIIHPKRKSFLCSYRAETSSTSVCSRHPMIRPYRYVGKVRSVALPNKRHTSKAINSKRNFDPRIFLIISRRVRSFFARTHS